MRIKFLRDELFENLGRNKGHPFKKGEIYDVSDEFGERWIRRGAAEVVGGGKNAVIEQPFKLVKGTKATLTAEELEAEAAARAAAAGPGAPPVED